jgi:hypothetical protein
MELHQLKFLGEISREKSTSVDSIFCRHGERVREYSLAHGPCDYRDCARCTVEMEILERLDRIEKMLTRMLTRNT